MARRYLAFHYLDHLSMSFIYGWLFCHTISYPRIEGVGRIFGICVRSRHRNHMRWTVFSRLSDLWHSSIYRRPKSNKQTIDFCWSSRSIPQVSAATVDRATVKREKVRATSPFQSRCRRNSITNFSSNNNGCWNRPMFSTLDCRCSMRQDLSFIELDMSISYTFNSEYSTCTS